MNNTRKVIDDFNLRRIRPKRETLKKIRLLNPNRTSLSKLQKGKDRANPGNLQYHTFRVYSPTPDKFKQLIKVIKQTSPDLLCKCDDLGRNRNQFPIDKDLFWLQFKDKKNFAKLFLYLKKRGLRLLHQTEPVNDVLAYYRTRDLENEVEEEEEELNEESDEGNEVEEEELNEGDEVEEEELNEEIIEEGDEGEELNHNRGKVKDDFNLRRIRPKRETLKKIRLLDPNQTSLSELQKGKDRANPGNLQYHTFRVYSPTPDKFKQLIKVIKQTSPDLLCKCDNLGRTRNHFPIDKDIFWLQFKDKKNFAKLFLYLKKRGLRLLHQTEPVNDVLAYYRTHDLENEVEEEEEELNEEMIEESDEGNESEAPELENSVDLDLIEVNNSTGNGQKDDSSDNVEIKMVQSINDRNNLNEDEAEEENIDSPSKGDRARPHFELEIQDNVSDENSDDNVSNSPQKCPNVLTNSQKIKKIAKTDYTDSSVGNKKRLDYNTKFVAKIKKIMSNYKITLNAAIQSLNRKDTQKASRNAKATAENRKELEDHEVGLLSKMLKKKKMLTDEIVSDISDI